LLNYVLNRNDESIDYTERSTNTERVNIKVMNEV